MVTTFKTLAVIAALVVGASSLAIAQNGPPTGGNAPVAGGAGGGGPVTGKSAPSHMTKHKKKETPPS